ncbi:hypothetical protein [Xenorhabdus bovienii]|uniref:hypothetical protein n=1 Tax=Xenorhabdus bovienii TaxID=40576 RepID=UPI0023B291DC|nr:hypothetical protein [Xenorhabdus bovienii]MDE9459738.1 hypothetical protein [Xenorhabdus bovienii]MDE9488157.1 hypothetical protein [Xenorhabdus bovienii]MDE9516070.1 hypothetical protein [Xenorhabdus bovienii]
MFFLRAAHFLPLAAFIVANQLPHPQLNLTELHPLALVLLPEANRKRHAGLGAAAEDMGKSREIASNCLE